MKRLVSTIVGLALWAFPFWAFAQTFWDVPDYHKNLSSITAMADLGVVSGYPDGSFKPDDPIDRAEAVKVLVETIKPQHLITSTQYDLFSNLIGTGFSDVPQEEWFSPYVVLASQNGIVQGYPDGLYRPGRTINMAEGLKIILEAYGTDVTRTRFTPHPLILMEREDWFAPYFGYAYNHNLINREKFYFPGQPMTRGEFVEILFRAKTIRENGQYEYPITHEESDEYTITIPRLNIYGTNVTFADPFDSDGSLRVLKDGLGHYLSPPGGGHKMVLFGHSSGYSWDNSAFKRILTKIDQLQIGDMIYVNYREKGYIYQINQKEIRPATEMIPVMEDYGYEEMALYTCWPPNSISKRYIVYATPIN